jgi:hypothetical protein
MPFKPNKINTPLMKTSPGQSVIKNIKSSTFLPGVFRSDLNDKWLDGTMDLMISKGKLEDVDHFVGSQDGNTVNSISDVYLDTVNLRHLQPTIYSSNDDSSVNKHISWNQIKDKVDIEFNEYDYNSAYSTRTYVFNPPVDIDKLVNYNNYYWASGMGPALIVNNTDTNYNPVTDLTNRITATIPYEVVINNTVVVKQMQLWNGMRLEFKGTGYDTNIQATSYIVAGVGNKIKFIPIKEMYYASPHASKVSGKTLPYEDKHYTVCSLDDKYKSSWTRANRWIHHSALEEMQTADDSFNISDWGNEGRRAKRPIIQFDRNLQLYNYGYDINHGVVDYLISSKLLETGVQLPNDGYYLAGQHGLSTGDTVVIKNTDTQSSFNKIFEVSGNQIIPIAGATLTNGHYFTVGEDYYNVDAIHRFHDYYWQDDVLVLAQTKTSQGDMPLFELSDHMGTLLSTYNNTTFTGNRVFGYKIGTGTVDPELGFAPVISTSGVKSEHVLENVIDTERYTYLEKQNNTETKILGNYYANYGRGERIAANYVASDFPLQSSSKVQVVGNGTEDIVVPLPKSSWKPDVYYDYFKALDELAVTKVINNKTYNTQVTATLMLEQNVTHEFKDCSPDQSLSFIDPGSQATFAPHPSRPNVWEVTLPDDTGYVMFYTDGTRKNKIISASKDIIDSTHLKVYSNGQQLDLADKVLIDSTNVDIVERQDDQIVIKADQLGEGDEFIIDVQYVDNNSVTTQPRILNHNPSNERIIEFTISETSAHWKSLIANQPGFHGSPTGKNNYDIIPKINNIGGEIYISDGASIIQDYTTVDYNIDLTEALKNQATEWWSLRKRVVSHAKKLYKTNSYTSTRALVNDVLDVLISGQIGSQLHKKSSMLFKDTTVKQDFIYDTVGQSFITKFNYDEDTFSVDHINVYLIDNAIGNNNGIQRLLKRDDEYTISNGMLTVNASFVPFTSGDTNVRVEVYNHGSLEDSYIPASITKLGLANLVRPQIIDNVLYCHDGYTIDFSDASTNDPDDIFGPNYNPVLAVLYDIEKKVWNGINKKVDHLTDATHFMPTMNHSLWYTHTTMDEYVERFFMDWQTKTGNTDLQSENYYDPTDDKTWNYTGIVLPGKFEEQEAPGHWKGIYHMLFGTCIPHLTPWNMLGFAIKPTWWNTHYSWTDSIKRAALLNALEYGIISEPGTPVKQRLMFMRSSWDWASKCPVKADGTLEEISTVLGTPLEKYKPFVFGDWGPTEYEWRQSPLGQAATIDAVIKLNPARTAPAVFQPGYFHDTQTVDLSMINNLDKTQFSNKRLTYHGSTYGKQVQNIKVTHQTGQIPEGTRVSIIGTDEKVTALADINLDSNGNILSLSVIRAGSGYTSTPNVTLVYPDSYTPPVSAEGFKVWPSIGFSVTLRENFKYNLGIDQVLYNSNQRNRNSEVIGSTFNSLSTRLLQPLNGFTDKNLIKIKSESGTNGRYTLGVRDYQITMAGGLPELLLLVSDIKIKKTDSGYIVDGYSNHRQEFLFYEPLETQQFDFNLVEIADGVSIKKYNAFNTTASVMKFGTKIARIQGVYDFIRGYYEYLTSYGLDTTKVSGLGRANEFAAWAVVSDLDQTFETKVTSTVTFTSTTHSVLPFNSLPGGSNDIMIMDENGNITQGDFGDLCITRIANQLTIHPQGTNPLAAEPSEGIVSVISSSTISNSQTQIGSIQSADTVTNNVNSGRVVSLNLALTRYYHSVLFNNKTQFNETIFNPITSLRQRRFKIVGQRTSAFDGSKSAPGYLIGENTIIQNFDTVADSMSDLYDFNVTKFNKDIHSAERITLGIHAQDWIKQLDLPDNVINKFMQGVLRHKGTNNSVDKFNRGNTVNRGTSTVNVTEDWMFKSSQFGDNTRSEAIELIINDSMLENDNVLINLSDISNVFVNKKSDFSFPVETRPLVTQIRKGGDVLDTEHDYIIQNVLEIDQIYNNYTTDFAAVETWSNTKSYNHGEEVRYNGSKFKLAIDKLAYNPFNDLITETGTVNISNTDFSYRNASDPVPSAIIEGHSFWWDRTTTTFPNITATGNTIINQVANQFTIGIDGINITVSNIVPTSVLDTTKYNNGLPYSEQLVQHDQNADVRNLTLTIDNTDILLEDYGSEIFNLQEVPDQTQTFTGDGSTTVFSFTVPAGVDQVTSDIGIISYAEQLLTVEIDDIDENGLPIVRPMTNLESATITFEMLPVTVLTKVTLTTEQLAAAINLVPNVDTEITLTNKIIIRKDIEVAMTIDGDGTTITNIVPGTYSPQYVLEATPTPMDISYIVNFIDNYLTTNGIDEYAISATSGNNLEIAKLSVEAGLSAGSIMTITDNSNVFGIAGVYNIGPTNIDPRPSTAAEVVTQITERNITGVTVEIINNRIVISKLVSVGPTLDLGDNDFNQEAGISTGIQGVGNFPPAEFNLSDWTNVSATDDALVSTWVLNDINIKDGSTITRANSWNVLNTQRTTRWAEIDAGDTSTDGNDAKVTLKSFEGLSSPHNVRAGDFVMILNSTTLPTTDGIHEVTSLDTQDPAAFYIDRYIEDSGRAEEIFIIRNARFANEAAMRIAIADTVNYNFKDGDILWASNYDQGSAVWEYNAGEVTLLRNISTSVDNTGFENVKLYNGETQKTIRELEVYDPIQGIIPGIAEKEIDFRYPTDVAVYNMSSDTAYDTNQRSAWGDEHVGKRWWDTSSVFYYDYKQGDAAYASKMWGKQIPGSSIDVYEWIKSSVTPESWADEVKAGNDQFGSPASGEAYRVFDNASAVFLDYYTEETYWNDNFNRYDSVYYFWVKNKITISSNGRTLSAFDISRIISDPSANGISWVAAVSSTQLIMNSVKQYITDSTTVAQLNIKPQGIGHSSWTNISEGSDLIPDYYYTALNDNLVGVQKETGNILPDPILHPYNRYGDNRSFEYIYPGRKHSQAWFKDTKDARREAISIINSLLKNQNLVDNLANKWNRIITKTFYTIPTNAKLDTTFPIIYQPGDTFTNTDTNVLYIWDGRIWRTDDSLASPTEYSGTEFPVQYNSYYNTETEILYRNSGTEWYQDAGWDMNLTWQWTSYVNPLKTEDLRPSITVASKAELEQVDKTQHEVVLLNSGFNSQSKRISDETYYLIEGEWVLMEKTFATIEFNDLVWNINTLFNWDMQSWEGIWDFDPSQFMSWIIQSCREDLFIESYLVNFNKMFFGMVHYIASIHNQVDWFYKTTYIKLNVDTNIATSNNTTKLPRRYYKGNIDVLQGYINDIKPFHTKIKSQVDISRISEKFNLSMDDSQNSSKSITVKYHDSPTDNWTGWQLTDGVIDTLDVYSSTFTDTNADIVTGGSFTDTEGLAYGGKFLDPGNFSIETSNLRRMNFAALIREAVSITVNTNTSGDVVDSNSTVHVYITGLDNTAAVFELTVSETSTISNSISKADNIITVADSSMFNTRPDGGIAFINGEIISYTAVIGNTLQNVQRGHGGSIALEHAAGTQIIDISDASILATDMYPWVSIKDPVPHLPILGPVS